jgi:hypothetical protein
MDVSDKAVHLDRPVEAAPCIEQDAAFLSKLPASDRRHPN